MKFKKDFRLVYRDNKGRFCKIKTAYSYQSIKYVRDVKGRITSKSEALTKSEYIIEEEIPENYYRVHAKMSYKGVRKHHDILIDAYCFIKATDRESAIDYMRNIITDNFNEYVADLCEYHTEIVAYGDTEENGKILYKRSVDEKWKQLTITSYL